MKLIAPSILAADPARLGKDVSKVEEAGADWIHVDVMDGMFVPNITIGPFVVEALKKTVSIPLDVHLMINDPARYIADFANAGASFISVHAEACIHLHRTVDLIKSFGVGAGAVLNPSTDLSAIKWVLEDLDFVLIMSVNPGFGGQKFIRSSLKKVALLKNMINEKGIDTLIQIDGGVNETNIKEISDAGVDVFVAGSAIFGTKDYKKTISKLKSLII